MDDSAQQEVVPFSKKSDRLQAFDQLLLPRQVSLGRVGGFLFVKCGQTLSACGPKGGKRWSPIWILSIRSAI
jgi:hypothetical protein